jgi:hypothetical protein
MTEIRGQDNKLSIDDARVEQPYEQGYDKKDKVDALVPDTINIERAVQILGCLAHGHTLSDLSPLS